MEFYENNLETRKNF